MNSPYIERVLIFSSDLMAIIEMIIRKDPLPRGVTAAWFTDKTLEWLLLLGKAGGIYCNILLVDSGHESYPA